MRTARRLIITLMLGSLSGCATAPAPSHTASVEADLEAAPRRTEAERGLVRGLVALKMGDYGTARAQLSALANACAETPAGNRALLALMSLEIDPRNPDRDLVAARRLGERYLLGPSKPAWTEPTAKTLYLLATELGAGLPPPPEQETSAGEEAEAGADAEAGEEADAGANAEGAREAEQAEPGAEERDGASENEETEPAPRLALSASPPVVPSDCTMEDEGPRVGPLEPPALSGPALAARHRELEAERDSLANTVTELERQVSELQRELERIRETLRP